MIHRGPFQPLLFCDSVILSGLRGIGESEGETDYWNRTLPSLGQACQEDRTHDMEDF